MAETVKVPRKEDALRDVMVTMRLTSLTVSKLDEIAASIGASRADVVTVLLQSATETAKGQTISMTWREVEPRPSKRKASKPGTRKTTARKPSTTKRKAKTPTRPLGSRDQVLTA